MPELLVWNDTTNEYKLTIIKNYIQIYNEEETKLRNDPKIQNAQPPYTDKEISQFVENHNL